MKRRTFILGAGALLFSPKLIFPASANQKILDYGRDYSFEGEVNAFPIISRNIEGYINFKLKNNLYNAEIDIRALEDEKTFHYGIKSKGIIENNFLKPALTITTQEIDLWIPNSDRNDKTTLDYLYEGDRTHIDIKTDFYEKGGIIQTNKKSREHKGTNGLDYISAIFQIILSNRQGISLDKINLISKMGKAKQYPLKYERKKGKDLFSLLHEDENASEEISLALGDNSELVRLSFSPQNYGIIEMNVKNI